MLPHKKRRLEEPYHPFHNNNNRAPDGSGLLVEPCQSHNNMRASSTVFTTRVPTSRMDMDSNSSSQHTSAQSGITTNTMMSRSTGSTESHYQDPHMRDLQHVPSVSAPPESTTGYEYVPLDHQSIRIHPKLKGRFIPASNYNRATVIKTASDAISAEASSPEEIRATPDLIQAASTGVGTNAMVAEHAAPTQRTSTLPSKSDGEQGATKVVDICNKSEAEASPVDEPVATNSSTLDANKNLPNMDSMDNTPQVSSSNETKPETKQVDGFVEQETLNESSTNSFAPLTLYDKLKHRRARESELKQQQKACIQKEPSATSSTVAKSKETKTTCLLQAIQVGSRIAVYWDGEGAYFSGTVKKIREERKRPFFVAYDDGDREWMDLSREDFRMLKKKKKKRVAEKEEDENTRKSDEKKTAESSDKKVVSVSGNSTSRKAKGLGDEAVSKEEGFIDETSKAKSASKLDEAPSNEHKPKLEKKLKVLTKARAVAPTKERVKLVNTSNGAKRKAKHFSDSQKSCSKVAMSSMPALNIESRSLSHSPLQKRDKTMCRESEMVTCPEKKSEGANDDRNIKESPSWVEECIKPRSDSDSETDEEEVMDWAAKMFGIRPSPITRPNETPSLPIIPPCGIEDYHHGSNLRVHIPISEKVKRRRQQSVDDPALMPMPSPKKVSSKEKKALAAKEEEETDKRRREANRPLTAAEIQAILRIEDNNATDPSLFVRRSMRQPNRAALNTPGLRALLDKLRNNDTDMVVLKMKKYVNDPGTPQMVIDAVLDALEENTNCEALYIQNFNEGMRDEQVLRLTKILQKPSCKIWCLNIGENYKVKMKTWQKFTDGMKDTKITHMYTSEHTITNAIKDQMRAAMRENRKKHDMHNNPENLDTIIQCTHCWWNPINAKQLQPYLKKRGYDHILMDVEAQGLKGTTSGADLK